MCAVSLKRVEDYFLSFQEDTTDKLFEKLEGSDYQYFLFTGDFDDVKPNLDKFKELLENPENENILGILLTDEAVNNFSKKNSPPFKIGGILFYLNDKEIRGIAYINQDLSNKTEIKWQYKLRAIFGCDIFITVVGGN